MSEEKPRGFITEPEEWMIDLIKEHGSTVEIGKKTYYYLPIWWEIDESHPDILSWYHMNILPQELSDFIVKSRLGGDNPQPTHKILSGIELTEEDKKWMKEGGIIDGTSDLIRGDPSKPVVEIWMEGYRATGESSTATMLNQYHADSFDEAMTLYMEDNPGDVDVKKIPKNSKSVQDSSFTKQYSIWACRLFDNETDARKSFG